MYRFKLYLIYFNTMAFKFSGEFLRQIGNCIRFPWVKRGKQKKGIIVLESGIRAVDSIYFVELKKSLDEFVNGKIKILSLNIFNRFFYIAEIIKAISFYKVDFYVYDPRTGSQNKFIGLLQVCFLSVYFGFKQTTPIICLTDPSIRQWRYQAALLGGRNGVIFTFLDPKKLGILFKGLNVIGPCFMPLSQNTFDYLQKNLVWNKSDSKTIFFCGSLYNRRIDFFSQLDILLQTFNTEVKIKLEEKSKSVSERQYWNKILKYNLIITTTFQEPTNKYRFDQDEIDQFVFRITEALSCQKVLISTIPPGLENYLIPGEDFIELPKNLEAGIEDLIHTIHNTEKLKSIALNGHLKISMIIKEKKFWSQINDRLENSMI